MTETDKEKITKLRLDGLGYKAIATRLNLTRDAVRKYCQRCNLDGTAEAAKLNHKEKVNNGLLCQNCGNEIVQPGRGRKKKFCSDKCRTAWWTKNYELHKFGKQSLHKAICAECGKKFVSYSKKNRKYCSHKCYIKDRFGGEEND
jgi:endogenous inhibitor of DNA gyrase (YacG/DUF329 family)